MRPVRSIALGILIRVERDAAHAAPLLDAKGASLPPRDRDLLRALVKGTLRHALRLDHVLARSLDRPMAALEIPIQAALRLGAAQLLLFDRIPAHAAVAETVSAAKEIAPRGAGLVNAVLRKVAAREERPGRVEVAGGDRVHRLALETAHPFWLVRRWVERFGFEAAQEALVADNVDSPIDLLADPRLASPGELIELLKRDGITAVASPWAPLALTVLEGGAAHHPLVISGEVPVVDVAAQAVVELVPRSDLVVDLTAAPGGKTRTLLARGKANRVIALERQGARVNRLARNLSASRRREEVLVIRADATHPPLPRGRFPSVLLDAPCSGTGTLRKNPEIRTRLSPDKLAGFAATQRDLLRSALELVAEGGALTWITCSLEPEENEEVVEAVISERSDVELSNGKDLCLPEPLAARIDGRGWVRILPGRDHDGFSAVTLRRLRQGIR